MVWTDRKIYSETGNCHAVRSHFHGNCVSYGSGNSWINKLEKF